MKRLIIILFTIGATAICGTSAMAMSKSKVRKEARFLTDKMAYELSLSANQRNDAYEVNYDFIYSAGDLMDHVLRGEEWAMDRYYYLLDIRNDDLRWVLNARQYRQFMDTDYFYRPIYTTGNKWQFRIYITYTNHSHFYYGKPYHYTSYHCGHHRTDYSSVSYYNGRYNHNVYVNVHSVRDKTVYYNNRGKDFGSVTVRPGTSSPRQSVGSSSTSRPRTSTSSSVNSSANSSGGRTNTSSATSTGTSNSSSTSRRPAASSSNSNNSTKNNSNSSGTSSSRSSGSSVSRSSSSSSNTRTSTSGSSSSRSSSSSSSSRSSSSSSGSGGSRR